MQQHWGRMLTCGHLQGVLLFAFVKLLQGRQRDSKLCVASLLIQYLYGLKNHSILYTLFVALRYDFSHNNYYFNHLRYILYDFST